MKKIMLAFGTRPEAIKMCPLVNELKKRGVFEIKVVVSGQHREMLYSVLETFDVVPDYDLAIMRNAQSLSEITARTLQGMSEVADIESPDVVLVHGDTTTAFSAALAGFYKNIPVGHVEAGLRSHDKSSPFPEEFNRCAVDMLSSYFFAPTEAAKKNLLLEGVKESDIHVTGNTVIDALKMTLKNEYSHPELLSRRGERIILMTVHRRENIGEPMKNIFRAVRRIVKEYDDVRVIYPIHMNPAVREIAEAELSVCEGIRIIEPLDVVDFHNFLARCFMVVTDSGGIQEEAPFFGKPLLVVRETTERSEGVHMGCIKLIGTSEERVYNGIRELLDNKTIYDSFRCEVNPYGDGSASRRICDILERRLVSDQKEELICARR